MFWVSAKRRLPLTIALLVGLVVLGTIVGRAHGPAPRAGETYTGTVVVQTRAGSVIQHLPIAFSVDAAGRHVGGLRFPDGLPSLCRGRRTGAVSNLAALAPIHTPSRFEAALAIRTGPSGSGAIGTLLISGTFHTLGRETGAVRTTFSDPALRRCGASGGYTAKAP